MATQIRLKIEICDYHDVPFKTMDGILDLSDPILFEILESDNVFVTFSFPDPVRIQIENYDDGNMYDVTSDNRFQLSTGREDFGCYFTGYFSVKISNAGSLDNYLFFVKPKNLQYENVKQIRNYVNDFYSGLSLDIQKKKQGDPSELISAHNPTANENIQFVISNIPKVLTYSHQYVESRPTETIKKDIVSGANRKIGQKSIQWLAKKGMTENENIYDPGKLLVRKTQFNINTPQNGFFRSELLFWNNELGKMVNTISNYVSRFTVAIDDTNAKIATVQKEIDSIKSNARISESVKKSKNGILKDEKANLDNLYSYLSMYKETLIEVKNYKADLEYLLFNSWVKQVSFQSTSKINLHDSRLKLMSRIHSEYIDIKIRNRRTNNTEGFVFAEKSTPKLFETYVFILLVNMLRENGYEVVNVNEENESLLYKFSNPSEVYLKKGDITCRIGYDTRLKKISESFKKDAFATIPGMRHDRPDFIISYHDSEGKILDSKVVEVKWRGLNNFYDENGETDVVIALYQYQGIVYHRVINNKNDRGVISKVIVIYPDYDERIVEIQQNEIVAIGLYPMQNVSDSVGYNNILNEIILKDDLEDRWSAD